MFPRDPMRFLSPRALLAGAVALGFLVVSGLLRVEEHLSWRGMCMGPLTYEVKIPRARLRPARGESLQRSIQQYLDALNGRVSTYDPDSEISRFNRHASTNAFPVSAEFADLVRTSLVVCAETDGAFDPTLGPLIDLWGFGAPGARTNEPPAEALTAARARTGWRNLSVTDRGELVKGLPDLQINLSAIACGWAVDRMADRLRAAGFADFYINLSGEVRGQGFNFQGRIWNIGVPDPVPDREGEGRVLRRVPLLNGAMATSGDYHNFFQDEEGRLFSHILDPGTGRPVGHDTCSMTVLAPTCAQADAYGTAMMVWGAEKALAWSARRPGVRALAMRRTAAGVVIQAGEGFPAEPETARQEKKDPPGR